METTAQFGDFMKGMDVAFSDVFVQNSESYDSGVKEMGFYKMLSGAEARKIFHNRSGTGFIQSNHEGGAVNRKERIPAYKTEAMPTEYDGSIVVTHQSIRSRDYNSELDEFGDLVRSYKQTIDLACSLPFVHAFDTSQPSTAANVKLTRYGDGVPLASTVHPTRVPGQSSQSNASSTGLSLTYTNFDTQRQAAIQHKTDDGVPTSVAPNFMLMVGPALRTKALEIARSHMKVDSADNNINVFKGEVVDVMENLYLTTDFGAPTDTCWFLIDRNRCKMFFWEAEAINMNTYPFENRSKSYGVFGAFAIGHLDWRGVQASKGDGVAYSS